MVLISFMTSLSYENKKTKNSTRCIAYLLPLHRHVQLAICFPYLWTLLVHNMYMDFDRNMTYMVKLVL